MTQIIQPNCVSYQSYIVVVRLKTTLLSSVSQISKTINMPETRVIVLVKTWNHSNSTGWVPDHQFPHLHGDFLHVHERLDVILRDVFSGHRSEAGSGLLLQVQRPAEACYSTMRQR